MFNILDLEGLSMSHISKHMLDIFKAVADIDQVRLDGESKNDRVSGSQVCAGVGAGYTMIHNRNVPVVGLGHRHQRERRQVFT